LLTINIGPNNLLLDKHQHMKKFMISACLSFLVVTAFAQQTPATTPPAVVKKETAKPKQVQNPAAWACPKCFMITKEGGQCSMDHTDKVQLGTYYCDQCVKATGNKPGKCPTCSKQTVQMTRKLCAQHNPASGKKAA
jgi:hypothetical protein